MAKLAAPSGFCVFQPGEHRKRQELIGWIRASYESFGFEGMDTPAMHEENGVRPSNKILLKNPLVIFSETGTIIIECHA